MEENLILHWNIVNVNSLNIKNIVKTSFVQTKFQHPVYAMTTLTFAIAETGF